MAASLTPWLRTTDRSCTTLQCICIFFPHFFFSTNSIYSMLLLHCFNNNLSFYINQRMTQIETLWFLCHIKKIQLFDIPQIICDSIHKLFIESNISDFLSVALRLNLRHLLLLKNHEYTLLNSILKHCIEPLTEWIFHIKPSQAFFII